jgi:hypothetical protein
MAEALFRLPARPNHFPSENVMSNFTVRFGCESIRRLTILEWRPGVVMVPQTLNTILMELYSRCEVFSLSYFVGTRTLKTEPESRARVRQGSFKVMGILLRL